MLRIGSTCWFSAFAAFFLATSVQAQAFSVPRSDQVLVLELTTPEGERAKVEVRDGSLLTVRYDDDSSYLYGFSMAADAKLTSATISPLDIRDLWDGGQEVRQLAKTIGDVPVGSSFEIPTPRGTFEFKLLSIVEGLFPNTRPLREPVASGLSPTQLKKVYGKSAGGTCCVSCGPLTICATRVTLDCGSCDSGGGGGGRVY